MFHFSSGGSDGNHMHKLLPPNVCFSFSPVQSSTTTRDDPR